MTSRIVMAVLVVGMLVSGAPGVFAEEPVLVVQAAKPDPAKATEELKVILKELDEARKITDGAKRKRAVDVAKAKLTLWNDLYKELRATDKEKMARAVQNKELADFLKKEKEAQAEKDAKKKIDLLKALHDDLNKWKKGNCTEEGEPKDGLFTTRINCDSVNEVLRRVRALLFKLDPTLSLVPSPSPIVVAIATPVPTSSPTPTATYFVSVEFGTTSYDESLTDVDVDITY